ncbi:hypothetical protein ACPTJ1_31290, partial [Pseudomonas aeruginosa]
DTVNWECFREAGQRPAEQFSW